MLERVEKYEIVEEIGHGGMATVYRARDTRLERDVALKVMHPHLQGAREARQRFAREALTVARLRHPSILEIYDYSGEDSDTSYIATELLTGPTLKHFAAEHSEIPPELAACAVLQVARALGAAHAAGVIHRDVKPENVMLHEDRCVKLTDFGIAQLVDVQGMTTTGQVLGSPLHMAPEQIEGKECDARSDLFSLGTVLYQLATGELPFTGQNPHQVLKRIMDGQFRPPQQARPAIGGRLAAIIERMLETDPTQRYPSAAELERDLLDFVGELGIDQPDKTLAEYLADPEAFARDFRSRSIERLSELGERAQRRGQMPEALDYFNRVLAMDDGNARVLDAVERLGRRSRLRRAAAWIGAAAAAAGLVAVVALQVIGVESPKPPAAESVAGAGAAPPAAIAPVAPSQPRSDPEAATPTTAAPKPPSGKNGAQKLRRERDRRSSASGAPRLVTFRPSPANVSIGVDGAEPRAFGPSFRSITLKPGTHSFRFVGAHDCCEEEQLELRIPPGDEPFVVQKSLRFKPATLYVVSDTAADVWVDGGRVKGRTNDLIAVPELRALSEMHDIRVSADGRQDHSQAVRLTAGKVAEVRVALAKVEAGGS